MNGKLVFVAGACSALGARALFVRAVLSKLRRDLAALNAGDPGPLLKAYADDAVLVFNDGDHRWAGEHRGKAAIERFLHDFMDAGVKGEITELAIAGPPWAMTLVGRFDDEARGPDGEQLYANRVVLHIKTRWGKIVRHGDFYEDTKRIEDLEQRLRERDAAPVSA
jgi:ketosteroid isomerase-like protein